MLSLRQLVRSPALALAGLVGLAAWPVVHAGYPAIGDGLPHFYRLVEFDHLLRQGVWFPRWAADLCYGYGCPLFNFYPPLTYYAGAAFHALGFDFAQSLLVVAVLALALAVAGAYALARERWGARGAFIAAAAYGLSPYLYFNLLARGAIPETLGLGLLPWVLWAFVRLARHPSAGHFTAAALLYATLCLTHLLGALLAGPLMVVFVLLGLWRSRPAPRSPASVRPLLWCIGALALALLLAAGFILPAVFETGYVHIQQLTLPGDLDFHHNFLSLTDLWAWPRTFDGRLVFIPVPPSLSLAALGLAGLGVAVQWLAARKASATPSTGWSSAMWASLLAFGLFTLPVSTPLWERLPLANLIQFPWRLVGPASLLLALLTAPAWGPRAPSGGLALSLAALFFYSLTWSFAPPFSTPAAPTVEDLTAYERTTGQLGLTSAGEFLPRDVQALPPPAGGRLVLPPGVSALSQTATAVSAWAEVEAQAPAALTFNIFYFPGWQATVDGQPAPIRVSYPSGLITVPIASGRHAVAIQFGDTPLRSVANGLSRLGLPLLALAVYGLRRRQPGSDAPTNAPPNLALPAWTVVFVLGLWLARAVFVDGRDTLLARSRFDGANVAGAGRPLDVNFDNQLVAIGLDLPQAAMAADGTLPLTLYWRAQNPPQADYSASVQVVDAAGNLFGQSDSQNPGRLPTSRWRLDQYAEDNHRLTLLPGTPPGVYTLTVGVYAFGGPALSVLDENQVPRGQAYPVGTIAVTRAQAPPSALNAGQPLDLALGPLTLIGATLNTTTPQAGDELRLTLFWRAGTAPRPDLQLQLEVVTPEGQKVQSQVLPPARADYGTSAWAPGEVVRAPLRLRIPASAPAGAATLQASLLDGAGSRVAGPAALAALDLRIPARSFVAPSIAYPRADEFGSQVRLLGYALTPEGLTLYWQALGEMEASYTIFVHALDAGGNLVAQSDTLPAGGARPTPGWLRGEIIADAHALSLTGAAQIEVGLYDAQTGARLGTARFAP